MNQPQAQGSYFPRNQAPGPRTATSHLPNTFLSSSESGNLSNTNRNLYHNSSFQDMNTIVSTFLQSCGHNVSINPMEDLLSLEHLSDLRDHNSRTLLMVAAEKGSLELVQKSLELGISINMKDRWGKNALFCAVDADNPTARMLSLLLDKGADANIKCQNGATPLLRAVEKGRYKISEILLKRGSYSTVKYETTGDTALHIAASKKDRKIVQLLLEHGCDPKRKNKKKQSVWDIAEETPDIMEILKNHQPTRDERPSIRRINSEAIYQSGYQRENKVLEEDENEKSDSHLPSEGVHTPISGPCDMINISNLPEPPSLVLSHANRNDDNYSNASTTCSNAHSEYRFNIKNNQSFNPVKNPNEEHGRYPDRNYQQSNPKSYPNRKREDSGVSRNSLTSVHSDMASDNESMSGHSQNNVTSDYSSQYFSPELHEKTRSTGSIGNPEPHVQGFMGNTLSKHNSYPYPFVQNSSEYGANYNNNQKRKYQKPNFQQGTKSPYQSQSSFEAYQNQSHRRGDFMYSPQSEVMGQNYQYSNKRESHEYMLRPQRSYPFSNDGQSGYQGYNNTAIGPRGQQNFIYDNNCVNPNLMFQPYMNGGFVPMDMSNLPNSNNPMHNPYFLKPQQSAYQHPQMPQDPLTKMFSKIQEEHNQFVPHHVNQNSQAYYHNQQTPPRTSMNRQMQQENFTPRDPLLSFVKDAKEGQRELENEKNENAELKALIEESANTSKELEEKIKERDQLLQSLLQKSQEMENVIKEKDPNFVYKPKQDQHFNTDSMLRDFRPSVAQDVLTKPFPRFKTIDEIVPILHEEILSFERSINIYYQENDDTLNTLIDLVKESLAQIAPEAECLIYGSFATGLGLPDSDIDIVVKLPQIKYACSVLEKFDLCIRGQEWVEEVKTIQNKTVPLLKITCSDAYLNKKIDITIQDLSHNGLSCVELVKEYLKAYPALKPLSLVLKNFLMILNLNDTYSGGLSSYGLLLMIVHFLQIKEQQLGIQEPEHQNYGEMLLSFLYFYGFEHDYYTHLAVNPKRLPKVEDIEKEKNNHLCLMNMINQQQASFITPKIVIQDPVFSRNNIGKSTFRIREIKHAFMAAYFEAFKPCTCEIHEYIEKMDGVEEGKEIQCTTMLRKMFLAYQPMGMMNNV